MRSWATRSKSLAVKPFLPSAELKSGTLHSELETRLDSKRFTGQAM